MSVSSTWLANASGLMTEPYALAAALAVASSQAGCGLDRCRHGGLEGHVEHGLLEGGDDGVEACYRLGSLDSGGLLIQSYEAYRTLHIPAAISFEHAWFLLFALGRRSEIRVQRCAACGALQLCDPYARGTGGCAGCQRLPG